MGTKNNPGKFDCYAKLDPDEPFFVLKSTDPNAPNLVRLWAALEQGSIYEAVAIFNNLAQRVSWDLRTFNDLKIIEAGECAEAMDAWLADNRKD